MSLATDMQNRKNTQATEFNVDSWTLLLWNCPIGQNEHQGTNMCLFKKIRFSIEEICREVAKLL